MIDQCPFCGAVKTFQQVPATFNSAAQTIDPTITCSGSMVQLVDLSKYTVANPAGSIQATAIIWQPNPCKG